MTATDRTLVVLGGADGALTTIAAARRLGVRTICVDLRADAPAAQAADEFMHRSTSDVAGIVAALADRPDVCAVASPASDVNVPHQYAVASALGLPCDLSPGAVAASTDKAYFREVCQRLGLPGPRYVSGSSAEVLAGAGGLGWPLFVKPVDLGGGRGVRRCDQPSELLDAVHDAVRWSPTNRVIVEEFVPGVDLGMEAVLDDGQVRILGVSRRVVGPPPTFLTLGHDMGPGPEALLAQVRPMLERVCAELGYRRGFLNADLIWADTGEVVIIEVGARLGGNGVSELLGLVHGIDTTEMYVQLATGAPVEVPSPAPVRHAASRVLQAHTPGTLVAIDGLAAVREVPGVVDVIISAQPGDPVEPYTQCRAKLGFVLAAADDVATRDLALRQVEQHVVVRVAPEEPLDARESAEELAS